MSNSDCKIGLRPANTEEVLRELDRRMSGYGNGTRLAEELAVETSHLHAIRSGARGLSQKVARGLGFELRWVRVRTKDKQGNDQQ